MKHLFLCVLAIIATNAFAQKHTLFPRNGVYVSDSDYSEHRLKDGFRDEKGCKLNNNRRDYLIVQKPSIRDTFYFDDIWGYRKDGEDWRVYKNDAYKVECCNNKICLYDIPGTGQGEGVRTTHYFSASLSGPVHHLSKRNLISVYHESPEFIKKVKRMGTIYKWNKASHGYLFMTWL